MKIDEAAILVRINQTYSRAFSDQALYEATRGTWRLGPRREKAEYAFAVYEGKVREVYKIAQWLPAGSLPYKTRENITLTGRWEFRGDQAEPSVRAKYIGGSVEEYFSRGAQNPVHCVNC